MNNGVEIIDGMKNMIMSRYEETNIKIVDLLENQTQYANKEDWDKALEDLREGREELEQKLLNLHNVGDVSNMTTEEFIKIVMFCPR